MKQGLAFYRGKDTEASNFRQTLTLLSDCGVSRAKNLLSRNVYLSSNIVTEICNIIGREIQLKFMRTYNKEAAVPNFSILADETRHLSGVEQLCATFRWVSHNLEIISFY